VRLKKVFWEQIIILHSGVSAAKKSQLWIDIYTWNAKIIVWTRSSLFYPYSNLWTIIVDEEHDNSYISDNAPRYNALEVAEKITDVYNIPLLLASWTPKVTTMYRWLKWDFTLLQLLEKFI
jgi:primosomal protein N' (replication factor Y)